MVDDITVINDTVAVRDFIGSNNDDITISKINIINFIINGISYQAEEGMTWIEWCNSEYNTNGYRADSGGMVFTVD
jgi:hypothetical protein